MCELLHTLNASFLECGEHAVGTEWRAVAFSAGGDGGILVMLTFTAVWEETMFLLGRYTVAAAVFLSASAASAVEDATLSADRMLPACTAFIRDRAPGDVDGVFAAGRCIGLMQGLGFASRLLGACPPDEVTVAQRARAAVTYVEARPDRMHEDFRALAVEAMREAWPCK